MRAAVIDIGTNTSRGARGGVAPPGGGSSTRRAGDASRSSADPRGCHRRLLVGKVLAERGVELRHIPRDGSVEVEREVSPTPPWRSPQPVAHRRRPRA
jgi:hypothetical protein